MVTVGIIGKPNVGKSTFFRAITLLPVEISDRPFTTLKPHYGIGYVGIECVEKVFGVKCHPKTGWCTKGVRFVPIKVVDIPGLVKEAHKGKGLGNKFLDATKNVDVLLNIIDIAGATDEEGNPVEPGSYNPLPDFEWVEEEVDLWFYYKIKNNIEKIKKRAKTIGSIVEAFQQFVSGLGIKRKHVVEVLNRVDYSINEALDDEEVLLDFARKLRKTAKPIVHVANKVDLEYGKKFYKKAVEKYQNKVIVPASAYVELKLRLLDVGEIIEYIPGTDYVEMKSRVKDAEHFVEYARTSVLDHFGTTGVQDALRTAIFNVLNYIAVWPVAKEDLTDKYGRILPDVYIVPPGLTVKEFASMIHSELGKKFIRAVELKRGEVLKEDYKLRHNDVIKIWAGK